MIFLNLSFNHGFPSPCFFKVLLHFEVLLETPFQIEFWQMNLTVSMRYSNAYLDRSYRKSAYALFRIHQVQQMHIGQASYFGQIGREILFGLLQKLMLIFLHCWTTMWINNILHCLCVFIISHTHLEWIYYTLRFPKCQGNPCLKQLWYLKINWLRWDSNLQQVSS